MSTTEPIAPRLESCFAAVFPALSPEQIRNAKQPEIEDWDSLAAVKLATLIEEEFEIELDFEEAVQHESFQALAEYLATLAPGV